MYWHFTIDFSKKIVIIYNILWHIIAVFMAASETLLEEKSVFSLRACLVSRSAQISQQILRISRRFFADVLDVLQEKSTKKDAKDARKMCAERY